MRNSDGTLNGDLNDNLPALTSGSMARYASSSLDENQTTYDLLPVVINRPPSIVSSITDTSIPSIKPYSTADASGDHMYIFPDDSVKINLGATITLKLEAEQPSVFNVENGIPKIIPSKVGLNYVWKKDGNILTSYDIESLQSELRITNNMLEFVNIQPEHAGTYTCEVSNDIGTVISEPVTLEILNLDFDSYFYKNLVQNPYGKSGTDNWESSTSDLISKPFSDTPSQEFAKPTALNIFGYTPDMLHPRPYQIDAGIIKGFDMTRDLLKGGTYFTRTRYKYTKKGGVHLIRAYQDIDLTDIEWLVKGGVFGVEGVRAAFSCYIGNALDTFFPTEELVDPTKRLNAKNYLSRYPRISVENFLNSGPSTGQPGYVYVTLEEYDNETRLASRVLNSDGSTTLRTDRILLYDPWTKRTYNYWNRKYYTKDANGRDKYSLGFESNGNFTDSILFIADELMPDIERRYTYGQYVEFNKVLIDRLHPNTTKIRITMHFETNDGRLFSSFKEEYEESDEPFEFHGWAKPYKRHTFNQSETPPDYTGFISYRIEALAKNKNKPRIEREPPAMDPRAMVTAFNLTLIPILTQNNATTEYYTNQMLSLNDTPASATPSGLEAGRGYDPYGLSTRRLLVEFKFNADARCFLDNDAVIRQQCGLDFVLHQVYPQQTSSVKYPIDSSTLYPFPKNSVMAIEAVTLPLTQPAVNKEKTDIKAYIRERFLYKKPKSSNTVMQPATWLGDNSNGGGWIIREQGRLSEPTNDTEARWKSKARFQLNFALPLTSGIYDQTQLDGPSTPAGADYPAGYPYYGLQSYFLEIDFTNASEPDPSGRGVSGSKVTISRPDNLFPGKGTVSFDVSHSTDVYGALRCQIPNSMLTSKISKGGMQYEPTGPNSQPINNYVVAVRSDLIQSVKAIHKNVGDYLQPNQINAKTYFNALGAQIVAPINRDLAYLQQVGSGSVTSTGAPLPVLYYKWLNYQEDRVGLTAPPSNSYGAYDFGITTPTPVRVTSRSEQVFYVYVQKNNTSGITKIIETDTIPTGSINYLTISRSFGQPSDPVIYWKYPDTIGQFNNITSYYTGNTNPPPVGVKLSQISGSAKTGDNIYVWRGFAGTIVESATPPANNSLYNDLLVIPMPVTSTGYGSYVYSGSFDYAELLIFSQSLGNFIQDKTKEPNKNAFRTINAAYNIDLKIKIGDIAINCTKVPANIQEIGTTQFSLLRRPSLYAVKPIDPSVYNDGVGSPSYGTDANGDWSITYLPIDDSYTKDRLNF